MDTVSGNLRQSAETLFSETSTLLGQDVALRDVNSGHSDLVLIGASYAFNGLSVDQKRLQSRLIEDFDHFIAIVRALLRLQPREVRKEIEDNSRTISEVIEQTHLVWHSSTGQAKAAIRRAIDKILEAVNGLYDCAEGDVIVVPDTNALIYSPAFQDWTFRNFSDFEILLVPTVLLELDNLKIEHRNPDVRQKAQSVIRQIKEYRRRGNLSDGIVIVAGRLRLRSTAVEPQVKDVFPWLDPAAADDRMLASFVEAMRVRPRSAVTLVTADINLQNKAEFAKLPFIEPPDATL